MKIPLTSYVLLPEGTNSGALAESFDDLTIESTSLLLLESDALLAFVLCWGLLCLLKSESERRKMFSVFVICDTTHPIRPNLMEIFYTVAVVNYYYYKYLWQEDAVCGICSN